MNWSSLRVVCVLHRLPGISPNQKNDHCSISLPVAVALDPRASVQLMYTDAASAATTYNPSRQFPADEKHSFTSDGRETCKGHGLRLKLHSFAPNCHGACRDRLCMHGLPLLPCANNEGITGRLSPEAGSSPLYACCLPQTQSNWV